MLGLFGKKNASGAQGQRLPGPTHIPDDVGRALVVELKQDPGWTWSLKAVLKPTSERGGFEVRVYEEKQAESRGVRVRDFKTFDEHPDLILFEGDFNKKTHAARIRPRGPNP